MTSCCLTRLHKLVLLTAFLLFVLPQESVSQPDNQPPETAVGVPSDREELEDKMRKQDALPTEVFAYATLSIIYIFHIYFVYITERRIVAQNSRRETYENFKTTRQPNEIWLFGLTAIVLPLGTGLLSAYFGQGGIWREGPAGCSIETDLRATHSAFQFSKAIFLLMITLEISYLLNLRENHWKAMLSGALIIDFVAFFAFTVIGPLQAGTNNRYYLPFVVFTGVASLISSLLTIYNARLFDQFALGSKGPRKVKFIETSQ